MSYSTEITLDKKTLETGLFNLLGSISTTISTNFETPALSHAQLRASSIALSNYLGHFVKRNLRRATTSLDPSNLEPHVFRARNPEEDTYDDDGNTIKGKKDWYRLVLSENDKKSGDVQILAEGKLVKNKEDLLDAFLVTVEQSVNAWVQAERNRDKALREKKRAALAEKGSTESNKPEKGKAEKRKRVKGKAKAVESGKSDDTEDMEDEDVMRDKMRRDAEYGSQRQSQESDNEKVVARKSRRGKKKARIQDSLDE